MTFQEFLKKRVRLTPRIYSGRFMFGKSCISVITDDLLGTIMRIGYELGYMEATDDGCPETLGAVRNIRYDSMGSDEYVIYWPKIPYESDEDDGYGEEEY